MHFRLVSSVSSVVSVSNLCGWRQLAGELERDGRLAADRHLRLQEKRVRQPLGELDLRSRSCRPAGPCCGTAHCSPAWRPARCPASAAAIFASSTAPACIAASHKQHARRERKLRIVPAYQNSSPVNLLRQTIRDSRLLDDLVEQQERLAVRNRGFDGFEGHRRIRRSRNQSAIAHCRHLRHDVADGAD